MTLCASSLGFQHFQLMSFLVDFFFIAECITLCNNPIKLEKDKNIFPRQSLIIFTFRVKLSDSIFFLLGHSPIVKLI